MHKKQGWWKVHDRVSTVYRNIPEFLLNQTISYGTYSALQALYTINKVNNNTGNEIRVNVYHVKEQSHATLFHTEIPKQKISMKETWILGGPPARI